MRVVVWPGHPFYLHFNFLQKKNTFCWFNIRFYWFIKFNLDRKRDFCPCLGKAYIGERAEPRLGVYWNLGCSARIPFRRKCSSKLLLNWHWRLEQFEQGSVYRHRWCPCSRELLFRNFQQHLRPKASFYIPFTPTVVFNFQSVPTSSLPQHSWRPFLLHSPLHYPPIICFKSARSMSPASAINPLHHLLVPFLLFLFYWNRNHEGFRNFHWLCQAGFSSDPFSQDSFFGQREFRPDWLALTTRRRKMSAQDK